MALSRHWIIVCLSNYSKYHKIPLLSSETPLDLLEIHEEWLGDACGLIYSGKNSNIFALSWIMFSFVSSSVTVAGTLCKEMRDETLKLQLKDREVTGFIIREPGDRHFVPYPIPTPPPSSWPAKSIYSFIFDSHVINTCQPRRCGTSLAHFNCPPSRIHHLRSWLKISGKIYGCKKCKDWVKIIIKLRFQPKQGEIPFNWLP